MQLLNQICNAWHFLVEEFESNIWFWLAFVQILKLRPKIGQLVLLFLKTMFVVAYECVR